MDAVRVVGPSRGDGCRRNLPRRTRGHTERNMKAFTTRLRPGGATEFGYLPIGLGAYPALSWLS